MIPYIDRTRTYYGTLGYPAYQWAAFDDVPFAELNKPVADSRLALITTAAPYREELGDQGPGAAYNAAAKFFSVYTAPVDPPPNLRISHLGYDRRHTSAEDPNTWLPIARLNEAVAAGALGEVAPNLVGAPTNRSQSVTSDKDASEVLAACLDQRVDIALLVPS